FNVAPHAAPGTYTVTVVGSTGDSASATFVVSGVAGAALTPSVGAKGTVVGVTIPGINGPNGGVGSTCSISGTPVSSQSCTVSIPPVGCTGSSPCTGVGTFIVSSSATPGPYIITLSGTGLPSGGISAVFVVQGPFIQLSDPAAIGEVIGGPTGTSVKIEGSFFPLSDTTCTVSSPSSGTFLANVGNSCSVFAGSGI